MLRSQETFNELYVGETANGTEDLWWILEGKDYPKLWWELEEPEENGNN